MSPAALRASRIAQAGRSSQARRDCDRQSKKITLQNSSQFGSVRVDSSMTAYHNPGTADAGDTFTLEDGVLKVTTPGSNPYALANGALSASAADPSPTTVEFFYDHNGLRTKKVVTENGVTAATEYTLHGKLITHLKQGSSEMHFFYDAQSRPAMVEFGGIVYTYVHNLQGDIVGIVDSAGALVVEYKYDAWGKPISRSYLTTAYETLGRLNPFLYRGYVYDEETELYYLRSRYYNPTWERFVNADSLIGKIGYLFKHAIFTYCENAPQILSDHSGRSSMVSDNVEKTLQHVMKARLILAKMLDSLKVINTPLVKGETALSSFNIAPKKVTKLFNKYAKNRGVESSKKRFANSRPWRWKIFCSGNDTTTSQSLFTFQKQSHFLC